MDRFRTKTGHCVLDDRKVRLEPDLGEALGGYDEKAILLGAGALVGLAGLLVATGTSTDVVLFGVLFGFAVSLAGVVANVYRERSRIGEIPFEQINYVTVREGRLGTLSPRFVIDRESREGAAIRYVMMHSIRFSSGREEFERGKRLFQEHGLELRGTVREEAERQDLFEDDEAGAVEDGEDDGPSIDDIVDDVPETETPAGIDYDRYQRVQRGEIDEELPEEFQNHFPDDDR
jgi:hypothetical protein